MNETLSKTPHAEKENAWSNLEDWRTNFSDNTLDKITHSSPEQNPPNIHPELPIAEISTRFETEHFVKIAPTFSEQVQDESRTNQINYVVSSTSLTSHTSDSDHIKNRESLTEHESLIGLMNFLENATKKLSPRDPAVAKQARYTRELKDTLTFIGKKEYDEATRGIAKYWSHLLKENSDLILIPVAGIIKKQKNRGKEQIKSDEFVLNNILDNIPEQEYDGLTKSGRLRPNGLDGLDGVDPKNVKVILVDDWTISGDQLKNAAKMVASLHPALSDNIEIQLIASNKDRVENGLKTGFANDPKIPLRSYYLAHNAPGAFHSQAHITGCYSSVDFNFELDIRDIVKALKKKGEAATMPPLTNIVRPYRQNEAP